MVLIVHRLELDRRDVTDRREETLVVDPLDPIRGCELDSVDALPWSVLSYLLGRVEVDDGLRIGNTSLLIESGKDISR